MFYSPAVMAAIDLLYEQVGQLSRRMDAFESRPTEKAPSLAPKVARSDNSLNENPIVAAANPVEPSKAKMSFTKSTDRESAFLDSLKTRRARH
jgi:hypothetical protein